MDDLILEFTIEALDDGDGINDKSFYILQEILEKVGERNSLALDIIRAIDGGDNRVYLSADAAEKFRSVLVITRT